METVQRGEGHSHRLLRHEFPPRPPKQIKALAGPAPPQKILKCKKQVNLAPKLMPPKKKKQASNSKIPCPHTRPKGKLHPAPPPGLRLRSNFQAPWRATELGRCSCWRSCGTRSCALGVRWAKGGCVDFLAARYPPGSPGVFSLFSMHCTPKTDRSSDRKKSDRNLAIQAVFWVVLNGSQRESHSFWRLR